MRAFQHFCRQFFKKLRKKIVVKSLRSQKQRRAELMKIETFFFLRLSRSVSYLNLLTLPSSLSRAPWPKESVNFICIFMIFTFSLFWISRRRERLDDSPRRGRINFLIIILYLWNSWAQSNFANLSRQCVRETKKHIKNFDSCLCAVFAC